MAFEARLVHGSPTMVDYTPGSAVDAGDVIVIGETPMIAHLDIAANALGALGAVGGVYEIPGDAAIDGGDKVHWDNTAKKVTETAAANSHIGFLDPSGCSGDTALCRVVHLPGSIV